MRSPPGLWSPYGAWIELPNILDCPRTVRGMPLSKGRVHYGIGDLITVQSLGRGLVIDVSLNEVCHEESVRPRRFVLEKGESGNTAHENGL